MNFLKEIVDRWDEQDRVRKNNARLNAIIALREKMHCDHNVVVHTNHDGFYRHQCTKCGNILITPIRTIADAKNLIA